MKVTIVPPEAIEAINQGNQPTPHIEMFNALVDTGATTTCITKAVADKVGLVPIGKVPIQGVSGQSYHNNYLFHVGFTFTQPPSDNKPSNASGPQQVQAHFLNTPIQGAELNFDGDEFQVLLGMDVISSGSLAVEGVGTYSFSF